MLRAFKEQLKYLSQVSDEVVIKKINIHSHREDGVSLVKPVRNLILVMPDLIEQIRAWSNDSDIPVEEKKLNGFVLTYLYHPVDFLPEAEYGFFGYLDDAYMVGKIFARMTARLQVKQVKMTDNILDISRNINDWLEKVRQVIPEEVKKIDALIDDLSQGHLESFDRLISQEGGGYELNQTRQEEIKSSAI